LSPSEHYKTSEDKIVCFYMFMPKAPHYWCF